MENEVPVMCLICGVILKKRKRLTLHSRREKIKTQHTRYIISNQIVMAQQHVLYLSIQIKIFFVNSLIIRRNININRVLYYYCSHYSICANRHAWKISSRSMKNKLLLRLCIKTVPLIKFNAIINYKTSYLLKLLTCS